MPIPEPEKNTRVNREGLEVHRYPTDVGSDEYPNYIMFNITKRTGDLGNSEVAGAAQQDNATDLIQAQSWGGRWGRSE